LREPNNADVIQRLLPLSSRVAATEHYSIADTILYSQLRLRTVSRDFYWIAQNALSGRCLLEYVTVWFQCFHVLSDGYIYSSVITCHQSINQSINENKVV